MSAGVIQALTAALLFAASIPASKVMLAQLTAFQLAGLLHLGGAMGAALIILTAALILVPSLGALLAFRHAHEHPDGAAPGRHSHWHRHEH